MHTADDMEIYEGMQVWPKYKVKGEGATVVLGIRDNITGEVQIHGDGCDLTTCYAERIACLRHERVDARKDGQ